MSKITQETAQRVIDLFVDGAKVKDLAIRFGLWTTSICNLLHGDTWPQCPRPANIKELIKAQAEYGRFKKGRICHIEVPPLTDIQSDIIVGSLLGDGWLRKLSSGTSNSSFGKRQSKIRLDYIRWLHTELTPYSNRITNIYSSEKLVSNSDGVIIERKAVAKHLTGYQIGTCQHPNLTALRNQWYKDDIKIVPTDLTLNSLRIAIWYFDDGSNVEKQRYAVICTQSFTLEEADFLCEKFLDFDMRPKIVKVLSEYTGRQMPILKFSRDSYDNLIKMVTPFMLWDCFNHKIQWHAKTPQHLQKQVKLTAEKVKSIFEMRRQGCPAIDIANKFGIHKNHVWAILRGDLWKHLDLSLNNQQGV